MSKPELKNLKNLSDKELAEQMSYYSYMFYACFTEMCLRPLTRMAGNIEKKNKKKK